MAINQIPGFSEPFSSLSHLIAAGVFLLLSIPMLRRGRGSAVRLASLAVFCFSAVLLLSVSGVYHLLSPEGSSRSVLRRLDHAAIFVLIASSFTPAHVILFRGIGRWGMLLMIWTIAAAAIACKLVWFNDMPQMLSLSLYLGMGWIGLGSGIALWRRFGFRFVEPLLWGGIAYSIGAVLDFLDWPMLVPGVVHAHEVFHVFVITGLAFHWAFNYVIAEGRLTPQPIASPPAEAGSAREQRRDRRMLDKGADSNRADRALSSRFDA